MADTISLSNSLLEVEIAATEGAALKDIKYSHRGAVYSLCPQDPLGFIMVPYCNRIRDGEFSFAGVSYKMAYPEKHAIHGDGRKFPWHEVRKDASSVTLGFSSVPKEENGRITSYPVPYRSEITYAIKENRVMQTLTLWNEGDKEFPFGGGFHPYFRRALIEGDDIEVQYTIEGEYPMEESVPLPTGPLQPVSQELNFSTRKRLPQGLDHCFGGWDGKAEFFWNKSGVRARITSPASHLVVYTGPKEGTPIPFFAFEPILNMNDGINLLNDKRYSTGMVILKPKESVSIEYTLEVLQ